MLLDQNIQLVNLPVHNGGSKKLTPSNWHSCVVSPQTSPHGRVRKQISRQGGSAEPSELHFRIAEAHKNLFKISEQVLLRVQRNFARFHASLAVLSNFLKQQLERKKKTTSMLKFAYLHPSCR